MIWLSEYHLPSFGNIWDIMGYQPMVVNLIFGPFLVKKAWFYEISPKLIIQYKIESFKNQIMNISLSSNLCCVDNLNGMPDNL